MEFFKLYKMKLFPGIEAKAKAALVSHAYNQLYSSLLTAVSGATIVLIILYKDGGDHSILFAWYAFFLSVALIRAIALRIYTLQHFPEQNLTLWKKLYFIGALLGGLSWGSTSILISFSTNETQTILVLLALALASAWSVTTLSSILSAPIIFILLAILPFIFVMGTEHWLFALGSFIFMIYLLVESVKMHNIVSNTIALQIENNSLLKNVSIREKELANLKTHDILTKIKNRDLFYSNFSNAIDYASRNNELLGLFYINFDDFKHVNDTFGHHTGDKLLLTAVKKLRKTIVNISDIYRLGDDEFAIVVEHIHEKTTAGEIAEKICRAIAIPIEMGDHIINLSVSVGISIYPSDGKEAEILLKKSAGAMQYVKRSGKKQFFLC